MEKVVTESHPSGGPRWHWKILGEGESFLQWCDPGRWATLQSGLHTQESLGSTSGTQEVWMGREVVVSVGGVEGGE